MKTARSYLRGVIAPEVHDWYIQQAAKHGTDLSGLHAEALEWFVGQLRKSSPSQRSVSILRAPRTAKLVDARVSEKVCDKVRKCSDDADISVRQFVYSALTLYHAEHQQT